MRKSVLDESGAEREGRMRASKRGLKQQHTNKDNQERLKGEYYF